jgi:hypothetical protein
LLWTTVGVSGPEVLCAAVGVSDGVAPQYVSARDVAYLNGLAVARPLGCCGRRRVSVLKVLWAAMGVSVLKVVVGGRGCVGP